MRIAIFLLYLGCAYESVPEWRIVTLPDGTPGAAVHCHGNMGACYERAGRACSSGYDVIDRDGHASVVGSGSRMQWETQAEYSGSLVIRCRR